MTARRAGVIKSLLSGLNLSMPRLLLISTVWAIGEFLGYATGRAEESLAPGNVKSVRQESQEAII